MTRSASAYGSCSTVPGDPGLGWSWRLTSAAMLPLSRKNTMPQPRLQWNDHAMLCDALPDLYNSIQIYTMPNCRTTVVSGCFGFFSHGFAISYSTGPPDQSFSCEAFSFAPAVMSKSSVSSVSCDFSHPVPQCPSALVLWMDASITVSLPWAGF